MFLIRVVSALLKRGAAIIAKLEANQLNSLRSPKDELSSVYVIENCYLNISSAV